MTQFEMQINRVAAPVRQQVYEQLKAAIVTRRFVSGQRLTEREFTEMTGVSRPTIREALQQLTSEGLISMIPGKGWVIATLTHEDAQDLYVVRAALEGAAGRLFVARATDAELEALREAVTNIESLLASGRDILTMNEAKARFYEVLLNGAHSETLVSLISGIHARIAFMRARTLAQPGRPEKSVQEIRSILEAISARDADATERECSYHVQQAAATIFGAIEEEQREAAARA